jgi:hypothetical protein
MILLYLTEVKKMQNRQKIYLWFDGTWMDEADYSETENLSDDYMIISIPAGYTNSQKEFSVNHFLDMHKYGFFSPPST